MNIMDGSEVSLNDLLSFFFFSFNFILYVCCCGAYMFFVKNEFNFGFLKKKAKRVTIS